MALKKEDIKDIKEIVREVIVQMEELKHEAEIEAQKDDLESALDTVFQQLNNQVYSEKIAESILRGGMYKDYIYGYDDKERIRKFALRIEEIHKEE